MITPLDQNPVDDEAHERADDRVEESDEESFPASDPPATQRFD